MAHDARDDGEVGAEGLAGEFEEGEAFGLREEEGLGVGAEDDEAGDARGGQVAVVCCLGLQSEGVGGGVEEGNGRYVYPWSRDRDCVFVGCWNIM